MDADALEQMESPAVDEAAAVELGRRLYGLDGGTVSAMVSYDDKTFWLRPERVVDNPNVPRVAEHGYTLKVTNSLDSRNQDFIEGQNLLFSFLADHGVTCPRPTLNKDGRTFSVEQVREGGPGHVVRLLEFIPGDILGKVPWQRDFAAQAGRELARINALMDEISIPAIASRKTEWSLWEAPAVLKYIDVVPDAARRALVQDVLAAFGRDTAAHAGFLERDSGLIHGDFNQHNLVVRRQGGGDYAVAGMIDLGDCHGAPRLFEVAMAAVYMALTSGQVDVIADVLASYSERRPLTAEAIGLLRVCMCARMCQSLVMGLRSHALDPSNMYVLDSQTKGWLILEQLWQVPDGTYEQQWEMALKA